MCIIFKPALFLEQFGVFCSIWERFCCLSTQSKRRSRAGTAHLIPGCIGPVLGKGSTQSFFLGFLLIGKEWDVIQGVFSVFSRNEKAECQRIAFGTEGQC